MSILPSSMAPNRVSSRPRARPAELSVREGIMELPGAFRLQHGGEVDAARVAWWQAGREGAPVVCTLAGISAHRHVFGTRANDGSWGEVIGRGRAVDAGRYRILSFDWLGGDGDSSGPTTVDPSPSISSHDQARILAALLDHLGIATLHAILGGSYGGMVALAFGELFPDRVGRLVVIGAADRAHPVSTAWRSVQRGIVRLAAECGRPADGLTLARAFAMTTYRGREEFAQRFDAAPIQVADRFVFPVESYLFTRGADYAARVRPDAFLCLSESIDLHQVDPARIAVPTTAIGVREDQLVPLEDVRAMVDRMPDAQLREISSVYGHDAFLKEPDQLRPILAAALEAGR